MKVSVIITSWNTRTLLWGCLRSIYAHNDPGDFEVVVVDNASVDGSSEMVANEFSSVRLIRNPDNRGFAGGNNQGIGIARGEYLLLLGSDTRVQENSIRAMVTFLDTHPDAAAVSCKLVRPDGILQRSCRRFPTLGNAVATYCSLHFLNRKYLMFDFDYMSVREVDQPDATCFMIRRVVVGVVGGFNERFSILYNDVDLCQRIKKNGMRIYFISHASVIHYGGRSTQQAPPTLRLEMYRNILDYYGTYVGRAARWVLLPILLARLLVVTRDVSAFELLTKSQQ